MNRRNFLLGTLTTLSVALLGGNSIAVAIAEEQRRTEDAIALFDRWWAEINAKYKQGA